ncbi:alpha/beta hydrolase [Lederbergia wuyishanensis]|uniref:Pimeloyl-ACP methyl ester carboxylesterase n=1 Tax=Lederbergia wuyishanensis TaxID=1347903 RepID=A0ABU0D084_9BACI|nr:alpha/beta hydrolase [Lederbergia wuyishanensis]MCJ8006428.1 alpha/beta hydrolase [Lederbergia wuyishanensis]MDQ0341803.1 pimeloyl-ACP methyl ester carboxylesterase [Lederbergia wuyishanensis]
MFKRKAHKIHKENSISKLFSLLIGNHKQWIYIRGEDQKKPVLLMVHGGPGAAQIGFIRKFQKEFEKHFVVVNWDQRGSGLSFHKNIAAETMTIDRFVDDTIELTNYLRKQFKQERIYLIGHSWGTIIGLLAIHKEPSLFYRYFGVAQLINYMEGEQLSYKYVLEKAQQENNQKAIKKLLEIGMPPWNNLKHDKVHQQFLEVFRGGISHDGKLITKMIKEMLISVEYSFVDMINHIKGQFFSMKMLQDELKTVNLNNVVREVIVPIYFCMGRHDLTIPYEPTLTFFNNVVATEKNWIWFEHSAHSPMFEEREKFLELILNETQKDRC